METTLAAVPTIATSRRRRKSWQRGSIYKRGAGYAIVYRKPDGDQKWESGFATKGKAKVRLDEVMGQIQNKKFLDPADMLFKNWCDQWLETKKGKCKPSTWGSYYSCVHRWIVPEFGAWYVQDITRKSVVEFFNKLSREKSRYGGRPLSRQFIKNVHTVLHELFDDAIESELAGTNPAHKIKLEGGKDPLKRAFPETGAVVKTFAKLPVVYQTLVLTDAITGLRRGELLGLRWQDVDFVRGVLQVRYQLQRVKKSLLTENLFQNVERIGNTGLALVTPKSKSSVRDIEMTPNLVKLLREHRKAGAAEDSFVFQDEFGNPLDPKAVYKPLYAAQAEAKVPRFSPHGLRHLYCSLLEKSGASLKHRQERMGHSSAQTTDIYTHNLSTEGRKYAGLVEAAFPVVSQLLADAPFVGAETEVVQ